jgi:HAMP domain-containing protein/signal transduction histidine kinase/CheY-like chemotaxis protein
MLWNDQNWNAPASDSQATEELTIILSPGELSKKLSVMGTKALTRRSISGNAQSLTLNNVRKKVRRTATKNHHNNGSLSAEQPDDAEMLSVLTEVKNGNLGVRLPVQMGPRGRVYETLNDIISLNDRMMREFTRAATIIGKQGRLTQRIELMGIQGQWREGIRSLNTLVSDLVYPTLEIANVISSVAKGNLSCEMPEEIEAHKLKGEFLRISKEVNYMVKQLKLFSMEVTRVAREVGSEGKLGGQAKVKHVDGVWKELTDSVNLMAGNLTNQVRNVAEVTTAIARGNLARKITVDVKGEMLELKNTINTLVDQLNSFASEVTRVALEVGTEGQLGGQATVKGVGGIWKELTDSVNQMASNLTGQVRNIAGVTTAVANGDLSKKITVDVRGEMLELKVTVNTMVDQLNSFASEVTRVASEVGSEGKLGGQAKVKGVGGVWKDLTESVNQMADNLTGQVRNIAGVTTAVAKGDLSKKITVDAKGELLELKNTINTMVDQLNSFSSEVTRVAREVGSEGQLGGQANVPGVGGTWKDLTDSVNQMASNLTDQVRNIADVTTAVAEGDLSRKITVDVRGEMLALKVTINTMVDQLNSFGSEVTRVAREVGSEGQLGGQAKVQGVGGTWKDLTDSVNKMADNLTNQVRNIAEVTIAVARGDLSKKITVDVRGEMLELKDTINTMVDQLNSFASEVTRMANEVGSEGKLGGQANVKGVGGVWKDLTDSVNQMAGNLTAQIRNIANVSIAVANGDLSRKITVDVRGEILQLKETINTMVDQLRGFASEVTRMAREVGTEGKLGGQAFVPGVAGTWKDLTDSVNQMAGNLTDQVRNIAGVTTAVAKGDLSKKITVDVKGEMLELKDTINTMVEQLNSFAFEVTRVAREVGIEGKLGGQAQVHGVAGIWKDLTDSVNQMASNLTGQVRGIAKVVTSVARGNLKQKLSINALGELAQLTDTINEMIDTLAVFADQVTTVAREVGVEGRLGGQASVPGTSGIWKDLTNNVNQLAENLTTQVRAISEVATAVTKGDLTRAIGVEAKGELESLKDTINQMITKLRETTQRNQEQDWLKSNLTKFTQMLQGQKDLNTVTRHILSELAAVVQVHYGSIYVVQENENRHPRLKLFASYAQKDGHDLQTEFAFGEGLVGQCAIEKERILLKGVPKSHIVVSSGFGKIRPNSLIILPVLFENNIKAVIELASLEAFSNTHLDFLGQLTESIGIVLNTIEANSRKEELLAQSQSLAGELKIQQEELRRTNEELQDKALLLVKQKEEVETKNREVEEARKSIEEKANQLTITSKYKSEFLANMSHELRTPLNSLLILAQHLYENSDGNLTEKQVQYAHTIHSCGDDLIQLINNILDLSKIESGYISTNISAVEIDDITSFAEATFKPIAEARNLKFKVESDDSVPSIIETDSQRLNQILKNLLSNAFKFTEEGEVGLRIYVASNGWRTGNANLDNAWQVIAFSISDTGIGIPPEKQLIIFEAFQQAEGSTSRKYGGTGLGLSISRGLAELLGGTIELESQAGKGSVFTFYLPLHTASRESQSATDHPQEPEYLNKPKPEGVSLAQVQRSVAPAVVMSGIGEDSEVRLNPETSDDKLRYKPGDRSVLLVEGNTETSKKFMDAARDAGLKCVIATNNLDVFDFINRFSPAAVIIDVKAQETGAWKVISLLRNDFTYRSIPIHVISAGENENLAVRRGARSFVKSPPDDDALRELCNEVIRYSRRRSRKVLLVSGNESDAVRIVNEVANEMTEITVLKQTESTLSKLHSHEYDCIILDHPLRQEAGEEWMDQLKKEKKKGTPVIIYSDKDLNGSGMLDSSLRESRFAEFRHVHSPEHLLEELVTQLHLNHKELPAGKWATIENFRNKEDILFGKNILLVDDDARNLLALTTVLEQYNMNVVTSESGKEAINMLQQNPRIEMVLMDIMMPGMDGYETTRKIRQDPRNGALPIIAVTARALKGDRQKCIEAGASDYIIKPIKTDQLLSLMRLWLYK